MLPIVALLSATLLIGCRTDARRVLDAAPPPSLRGDPAKESERLKDELWKRASEGDPVDLARLADREGAGGLLEGLEEGGTVAHIALEALPFADDADAAYQRLGEIVHQVEVKDVVPVLHAIVAMAARPRRQTEPLDPPGLRSCGEALLAIATQKSLTKEVRVPAISGLRLLAERGAVNASAIPTDLDVR